MNLQLMEKHKEFGKYWIKNDRRNYRRHYRVRFTKKCKFILDLRIHPARKFLCEGLFCIQRKFNIIWIFAYR